MKAVVTGGRGFIGSRLMEHLGAERVSARSLSRRTGQDVTLLETLVEPMKNVDVVFHLASLVQSRPGPFEEVNVRGLENVLRVAYESGVSRMIYVSSFTVFGPSREAPHDEESQPATRSSFFHEYDRTKYLALEVAREWKDRLAINVVYPTVVYGPGPLTEGNIIGRLFRRWFLMRAAPLPGKGKPVWNFVFVDDLVAGLIGLLEADPGEDFILGGENCSLQDLSRLVREVSNRRILELKLPDFLLRVSCHVEDWGSSLMGFTPLVLPDTVNFLLSNWEFSSGKAERRLRYQHRGLREGLKETLEWACRKND